MKHLIVDYLNRWKWWILAAFLFCAAVHISSLFEENAIIRNCGRIMWFMVGIVGCAGVSSHLERRPLRIFLTLPIRRERLGLAFWFLAVLLCPIAATGFYLLIETVGYIWLGQMPPTSRETAAFLSFLVSVSGIFFLLHCMVIVPLCGLSVEWIKRIVVMIVTVLSLMATWAGTLIFAVRYQGQMSALWPVIAAGLPVALLSYPALLHFQLGIGVPLIKMKVNPLTSPVKQIVFASRESRLYKNPWAALAGMKIFHISWSVVLLSVLFPVGMMIFVSWIARYGGFPFPPLARFRIFLIALPMVCGFPLLLAFGLMLGMMMALRVLRTLPIQGKVLSRRFIWIPILGISIGEGFTYWALSYLGTPRYLLYMVASSFPFLLGLSLWMLGAFLRWGVMASLAVLVVSVTVSATISRPSDDIFNGKLPTTSSLNTAFLLVGTVCFVVGAWWFHRQIVRGSHAYQMKRIPGKQ